jgi:hypothetical protein
VLAGTGRDLPQTALTRARIMTDYIIAKILLGIPPGRWFIPSTRKRSHDSQISVRGFPLVFSRRPRRSKNGTPEERAAKRALAAPAASATVVELSRRSVASSIPAVAHAAWAVSLGFDFSVL